MYMITCTFCDDELTSNYFNMIMINKHMLRT